MGSVQRSALLRDLATSPQELRGALAAMPSGRNTKPEVDHKLAELHIDGTTAPRTWMASSTFGLRGVWRPARQRVSEHSYHKESKNTKQG